MSRLAFCSRLLSRIQPAEQVHRIKCRRTFLSDAYHCHNAWSQRLQRPALQNINLDEFIGKIQEQFEKDGRVSHLDMDILANKMGKLESEQIDYVQQLFYRFRHTQEALGITEATHHGLIRSCWDSGCTSNILTILKDKVNFGIFLDQYTANFLLDHFIKRQQYKEAAQVAHEMMLQEDLANPITRALSLYACHAIWKNPVEEVDAVEEATEDDDEEVWQRVEFLEHPWYDDHFDLPNDKMRTGKTLTLLTKDRPDLLGRSFLLLGKGLHEKFEEGVSLLKKWKDGGKDNTIAQEALTGFLQCLEDLAIKEPSAEPIEEGSLTLADVMPVITAEQKEQYLTQAQDLAESLKSSGQVVESDLGSLVKEEVETTVSQHETEDSQKLSQLYQDWEEQRQQALDKQVQDLRETRRREDIIRRIKALQEKEEKLRYFEEQERIALGISRKPEEIEETQVMQEEQFVLPPGERGKGVK